MKKILFDCGTRDATASFGILVLRASIGLMMLLGHGLAKWKGFSTLLGGYWKSPEIWPFRLLDAKVSLAFAVFAEVIAAGMLVLGLGTRWAAFILGFTMVVAAFHVHAADPWFMSMEGGAKEPALLYLVPMVVLIITGGGSFSLDSQLYHDTKRRRW